jgi:hypothetical protein
MGRTRQDKERRKMLPSKFATMPRKGAKLEARGSKRTTKGKREIGR